MVFLHYVKWYIFINDKTSVTLILFPPTNNNIFPHLDVQMQFTVLCSVELSYVVRLSAKFDFDYSFLIVCGKILKVFGMTLAIQSKGKFCESVFIYST